MADVQGVNYAITRAVPINGKVASNVNYGRSRVLSDSYTGTGEAAATRVIVGTLTAGSVVHG